MNRRRVLGYAAALVLVLAALDFRQRIHVPREPTARDAASLVPAAVPPAVPADRIRQDLATWLPGLRPVAGSAAALVDTGWSLALLGVFEERDGGFAVIRATPAAAGGKPQVQRVVEGDEVYGLRVARIESKRVVLQSGDAEQTLELFKAAPRVVGEGAAPAAAATPTAATPAVATAAPAGNTVVATELKAGEALKLPGNMPVVEAKLPPKDPNKKKVRPPPRPAQLQNP
ncbi:MAG: hypothetical protein NDI84_08915 [Steroidobacteraceae bacterium]|nr:hypothetical protein [Steroidobacteraceae bacterium]